MQCHFDFQLEDFLDILDNDSTVPNIETTIPDSFIDSRFLYLPSSEKPSSSGVTYLSIWFAANRGGPTSNLCHN